MHMQLKSFSDNAKSFKLLVVHLPQFENPWCLGFNALVPWSMVSNDRGTWMRVRAFLLPLGQKAAKHRAAEEERAEEAQS